MTAVGIGISPVFTGGRGGGVSTRHLVAARATYLFTGQALTMRVAKKVAAAGASFAFTGQTATPAIRNRVLAAGGGSFAMTGQAVTMTIAPALGHIELITGLGQFNCSGDTMTPIVDHRIPGGAGSFAVSGQAITPRVAHKISAAAASFAFTGQTVTLTKSVNYQGPGDSVAFERWGSPARSYSAAYAVGGANPAMDLLDQAGANAITINILSTGFVDVAAITTWVAAHSVSTIKITKLYDQTGNGKHWSNATLSTMPAITLSSLNSLPGITGTSAGGSVLNSAALGATLTDPVALMAVYKKTGSAAAQSAAGFNSSGAYLGSGASANTAFLSSQLSTGFSATASDNAYHSVIGNIDGASSTISVDGTETSGSCGTGTIAISSVSRVVRGNGGGSLDGTLMELGIIATGADATLRTALTDNAHHATRGYNF